MQYTVVAGIIGVLIIVLITSISGYHIGTRTIRQPFFRFLARYLVVFCILFLIEYSFLALLPSLHAALCNFTAMVVGAILGLAGIDPLVSDSIIILQNPPLSFEVTAACLGGVLLWVYSGLVFAESGVIPRQRMVGLIAGLSILIVFNIFRITLSIYLERQTGVYVHDYFYLFNVIFVLLVWAGWLKIIKNKNQDLMLTAPQ